MKTYFGRNVRQVYKRSFAGSYSDQSPSRAPRAATRGAARAACVSTWLGEAGSNTGLRGSFLRFSLVLSLHNPVARAARALTGLVSRSRCATHSSSRAAPPRLTRGGRRAPEGCRFAAAGPNNVRQEQSVTRENLIKEIVDAMIRRI